MRNASLSDLHLSDRSREALRQFLDRIPDGARARIRRVVVFGSAARGDSGPESDVDVLVVWRGAVADAYRVLIPVATDVLIESGVDISVHPFSEGEYAEIERLRTGFFENVERDGVVLA